MKYKSCVEKQKEKNDFKILIGHTLKRLGSDLIGKLENERLEAIQYLKDPDPEFLEQLELADLRWHYDKLEAYARQSGLL